MRKAIHPTPKTPTYHNFYMNIHYNVHIT